MKTCEGCKFALFDDFGYSNYTVEGTTFHCLKTLHPDGQFDRFYGGNPQLNFAEKCSGFFGGDPVCLDVDREDWERGTPLSSLTTDPDVGPLLDAWNT